MNPLLLTDFYKVGHPFQYPDNTTLVYSNLTPRKSRIRGIHKMIFFGLQYFIKEYLIERFNKDFFSVKKQDAINEYKKIIKASLGADLPSYAHLEKLHDLGYLPVKIKSLPEGAAVPMRVPALTIVNTLPDFYWVTNFLESILSAIIWQPCTSATIAKEYRSIFLNYAIKTGMPVEFVDYQGHDFSFRGMSSLESAILSGIGHLLSFKGTDTIPAILALKKYYNANDEEIIGTSVPATEHSVMCSGTQGGEIETFERLISEIYPNGFISIVSDTWDLWKVCTEYLPKLKEDILAREGRVVIRPDSGNPADIICGKNEFPFEYTSPENYGVIQLLWDTFGGSESNMGFKILDNHIGAIYGDSITLEVAEDICRRLMENGFASQVVLGIGSYTYQYNTRDTFGIAMKATYIERNGTGINIFKNPITDDGTKKSAKGLLMVDKINGEYVLTDEVDWDAENSGELKTIFENGDIKKEYTLSEIRNNITQSKYAEETR